ncbi:hypothetical protein J53TS2_44990 [Paenibacillus sp. J53TS2]|nr:hypothetical protein J53TS2_44990 [Paenibacillus sp. J53TS2]
MTEIGPCIDDANAYPIASGHGPGFRGTNSPYPPRNCGSLPFISRGWAMDADEAVFFDPKAKAGAGGFPPQTKGADERLQ